MSGDFESTFERIARAAKPRPVPDTTLPPGTMLPPLETLPALMNGRWMTVKEMEKLTGRTKHSIQYFVSKHPQLFQKKLRNAWYKRRFIYRSFPK